MLRWDGLVPMLTFTLLYPPLCFLQLQVIQPMFMHIDTLMNTIFKIGGEKENENLRRLNDVVSCFQLLATAINDTLSS